MPRRHRFGWPREALGEIPGLWQLPGRTERAPPVYALGHHVRPPDQTVQLVLFKHVWRRVRALGASAGLARWGGVG